MINGLGSTKVPSAPCPSINADEYDGATGVLW